MVAVQFLCVRRRVRVRHYFRSTDVGTVQAGVIRLAAQPGFQSGPSGTSTLPRQQSALPGDLGRLGEARTRRRFSMASLSSGNSTLVPGNRLSDKTP